MKTGELVLVDGRVVRVRGQTPYGVYVGATGEKPWLVSWTRVLPLPWPSGGRS